MNNKTFSGLDETHVAPNVGVIYKTCSYVNSPIPATKIYLVNYTPGN